MRLPYGIASFSDLRRGGYVFADKTGFIPRLESAEKGRRYLIFLRPRRMGKTLLLSMLEHYYDVLAAPDFDELFGGLEIARAPTPERGRYAVLRLEMTGLPTARGVDQLRAVLHDRVHNKIRAFLDRYREILPEVVAAFEAGRSTDEPASLLDRFLQAMRRSPYPLYLLIDEYDNFTNDLIARGDHRTYRDLVHASGFVREFYKTVKEGTALGIIGRIFMTGVSPVTLDDLTSGFNITSNISLHEDFNAFAGFTAEDVRGLVAGVLADGGFALDPAAVEQDLRLYYNGYLFSRDAGERIFNPDMVLYFLKELVPPSRYPRDLLDINVRTDYGRIQRLLFTPEGEVRQTVLSSFQAVITDGWVDAEPVSSFPLDRAHEEGYFLSLLYYMGLLTYQWDEGWLHLGIPNYAIRFLYWEAIAALLHDLHHVDIDITHVRAAQRAMARDGDIAPFLEMVFTRALRKLSNRDLIRLDEKTMKVVLLSYLSLSEVFFAWSEVELSFGYGDLVLVPNRSQPAAQVGFVVELKYLKAGATAGDVTARLDEADAQLRRYLADPKLKAIKPPKGWKAVGVVFVATEACWLRVLGGEARRLGE
ncbi:MAG: AAA family ATPase [Polyangiaceae bacterium]|nr:AAA family ATPase [Polyangiaceae bacterium]